MSGVTYDELVAAATVGVSRRPAEIPGLAGPAAGYAGLLDSSDPAAALMDAAALLVTARRAGVLPRSGVTSPVPAAPDADPELTPRAGEVLAEVLTDPVLVSDLLAAAARAGYLAPAPLLPALLDAAVRHVAVRPAVAAVLGERGRWLAAQRNDWLQVVGGISPGASLDPGVWDTGSRDERLAYLAALRDRDRAAARDLLATGWAAETGDDRADLLAVLSGGLSLADEDFLEAALDDRRAAVRAMARRLLAGLPGSGLRRRAAERAANLLRAERAGWRIRLVVTLPGEADALAVRDGIGTGQPSPGIGRRAWLLTQLIAAAPLTEWVTRLGLQPASIAAAPIEGEHRVDVLAGWRLGAISQASSDWAAALLEAGLPAGASQRPPAAWPPDHLLAALLPAGERAARAASRLSARKVTPAVVAEVTSCPGPWPEPLAEAVFDALRRLVSAPGRSGWPESLVSAAARRLPVRGATDYTAALSELAGAGHPCPASWLAALRRAARIVELRREFVKEIR